MDYIPRGTVDRSIIFNLVQSGLTVSSMKIGYIRYKSGDGTSFTSSTATALTALASITTAHTDNRGIYLSATSDDGSKFHFRADFPDAAFAAGADIVVCTLYDLADNEIASRIFTLEVDAAILHKYRDKAGLGIFLDNSISNTNTRLGYDGTMDNPVSTLAAARTLAAALGTKTFYFKPNPSVGIWTLDASHIGYRFIGLTDFQYQFLKLNSQNVNGTTIENMRVHGIQGGDDFFYVNGGQIFQDGVDTTQFHHLRVNGTELRDTITQGDSITVVYNDCYSINGVTFDCATFALNIAITNFKGGVINVTGGESGSIISITGKGELYLVSCAADFGTFIAGNFRIDKSGSPAMLGEAIGDQANFERQNVREAMRAAATGDHTIEAGSIEKKIDDIQAQTDQMLFDVDSNILANVQTMANNSITSAVIDPSVGAEIAAAIANIAIDGETLSYVMEVVMAMATGRMKKDEPSPGKVTLYQRDKPTPLTIMDVTALERTRLL